MFRIGGMRKLQNASNGGIVRFYVRAGNGRFSSTKITFMPTAVGQEALSGELLFANFAGFIVKVKQPQAVGLNSINFQTVKVVA